MATSLSKFIWFSRTDALLGRHFINSLSEESIYNDRHLWVVLKRVKCWICISRPDCKCTSHDEVPLAWPSVALLSLCRRAMGETQRILFSIIIHIQKTAKLSLKGTVRNSGKQLLILEFNSQLNDTPSLHAPKAAGWLAGIVSVWRVVVSVQRAVG